MKILHIHRPWPSEAIMGARLCPDCERVRAAVAFFCGWYGWDTTCLGCGRTISDGEWVALAFLRYARREAVKEGRRRWRKTPKEIRRWAASGPTRGRIQGPEATREPGPGDDVEGSRKDSLATE